MLIQNIILGFLLATLYGAGFHFFKGGAIWRLALYVVFGWIGFWGGHFLANTLGWTFLRVGTLNIGLATIVSFLVIVIGYWLSQVQSESKPARKGENK